MLIAWEPTKDLKQETEIPRPTSYALLRTSIPFLAFLMGSGDSQAQLLSNHQFDMDVSGWSPAFDSTLFWDPLDADASPSSGSALVTNLSTTAADGTGALQCPAGIVESVTYRAGAEVYIPGGQTETGQTEILVQWFSDVACTNFLDFAVTSSVPTSTPDTWLPVSGLMRAPAGSQSARVRLTVLKVEDTGSLSAHFDNVVLTPVTIFQDGFESGDTTSWTSTVP